MKILIIGSGMYVTGRHGTGSGTILASLAEISRTIPIEKVLIVSKNPANAAVVSAAAARINAALGTSLETGFEPVGDDIETEIARLQDREGFSGAVISVPDHLHYPYGKAVLRNNLHCLMVKPFTPRLAEALELTAMQRERGLLGIVEFHKRYDTGNLLVKRELGNGTIGKILYFTVEYSQRRSIPLETFRSWSGNSNIFQYLAVHYVDLIHFLTGFVPVRASALGTDGLLREHGIAAHDSIHAQIVWKNPRNPAEEFIAQFAVNWIDPERSSAMSDQKYRVIGTGGRIECDQKNRGVQLVTETGGVDDINPYFSQFLPGPDGDTVFAGYGFNSVAQFFLDLHAVLGGKRTVQSLEACRPSFRQACLSTALTEAVGKSIQNNGEWIHCDALP